MKRYLMFAATLASVSGCGNAQSNSALVPALERLGETGNAEALYYLGMAYQTGSGVELNYAKALDYFRKAASQGDPLAAYKLGCYYDGQGEGLVEADADLALRHKAVAAEAGYALAQQDVASLYARKGDNKQALAWLEKAAAQGTSGALMAYASVHNGADGIPPDAAKTAAYFKLYVQRNGASDEQRRWLDSFEANLSVPDRKRAETIGSTYRPKPTSLTLKALAGQQSAETLIAQRR